jgi:hypothetical protein
MSEKQDVLKNRNTTLRKVQAYHGERSMTIVLPREFADTIGIAKGDYLKVTLHGRQLILEKAELD